MEFVIVFLQNISTRLFFMRSIINQMNINDKRKLCDCLEEKIKLHSYPDGTYIINIIIAAS